MRNLSVTIRLSEKLKSALEHEAAKDYRTLTSLVFMILNEWISQKEGEKK